MRGFRTAYLAATPWLLGTAICTSFALIAPAAAQTTTGSIRGIVSSDGKPVAGGEVSARNLATGATRRAAIGAGGRYALSGLQPGSYEIDYKASDGASTRQQVTIGVGQVATLNAQVQTAAAAAESQPATSSGSNIVVTAAQLVETRTSEIATNVSTRQIENLPQSSRNFLNFADLAPGVRSSNSETRKTFSSGGVSQGRDGESLAAPQVNVFIDGVSLKSNVQQGGLVGQDSSRGNPFPQAAVQEFRVLSSNFKAEYEDAGTSVITAITKSGGNDFHGEAFGFYQDAGLRAKDYFQKKNDLAEPAYKRKQYGASLGGPIIKDKLFFFAAYEGNDEDRAQNVLIGQADPANLARFGQYQGSFLSPFREDLGFAKLSWQAGDSDRIELAGSIRKEKEIAGFGGQVAYDGASVNRNKVYTGNLRWTHDKGDFLNEASVDWLYYGFTPSPLNPDMVGQDYEGVIRLGGGSTAQKVVQKGLTFRDAATFSNVDFLGGSHVIKVGAKLSLQDYEVTNQLNFNPVFNYRISASQGLDYSFPAEARLGTGNPTVEAKNTQIGLFVQDDWEVDDHLTVNLGLRWDYETNAKNNNYETSPAAIEALRSLETQLAGQPGNIFRADDYISTGNNRKPYWKAFQPRVGLSYDIKGDQSTVLFAGYGRYFDRTLFRNAAEEALLDQYEVRTFFFSRDGLPRNGQPTIQWNDAYLSRDGLQGLIDSGIAPNGELRVIRNDTRPPSTDQFSVGIRQKVGVLRTSLSYTHIKAKDQVGYTPLNRSTTPNANGFYDTIVVPGYGTVVGLTQARASKYDGIFLTIDKPYSKSSPWSLNLAYTMAFSKERGYSFNFDFPRVEEQPYRPNAGNERHRVVLSGMVDLPWGIQASSLMQWGSGQPYLVTDQSAGEGVNQIIASTGKTKDFRQVDLRLTKTVALGGGKEIQLIAEAFNIFNRANFGGYDGFIPYPVNDPDGNPNFGTPNSLAGPPRSFQFGARFRF
ncbi:TonB-dependent receptor [Sphingobium sp.]|uniref:TonB-dependent receptor n=1 Tax=Sphingobium sp. TaxID=1912891 RepID=UPI002B6817EF|nr:TonB-dependent receptor [Sphingobium sp.]HUD93849.1 TonB-dependent receptor [Sphingobium sp.]